MLGIDSVKRACGCESGIESAPAKPAKGTSLQRKVKNDVGTIRFHTNRFDFLRLDLFQCISIELISIQKCEMMRHERPLNALKWKIKGILQIQITNRSKAIEIEGSEREGRGVE